MNHVLSQLCSPDAQLSTSLRARHSASAAAPHMALELASVVYSAPTLETPLARVSVVLRSAPEALRRFQHCQHFFSAHLLEMVHFEQKLSDESDFICGSLLLVKMPG